MSALSEEQTYWLGKLANLNAARTQRRGIAPHKPLMLLTVIDLIEAGHVFEGWVKYDVFLASRFRDYWELVLERQRNKPDITMPFHALGSERDQIWERFTIDGEPSFSKETTRLCSLAAGLFSCLQCPLFRCEARKVMVARYFTPSEQVMLSERLRLPIPESKDVQELRARADEFKARQKKGRDSGFKSDVLGGYYFTCALTGYRLDTERSSIVQAAHIHQHAVSGNDDARNGLALTPDAHWMFDAGLWTVIKKGDGFFIELAISRFSEIPIYVDRFTYLHQKPIHFHPSARLRPDIKNFAWHWRKHRFSFTS